MLNQLYERARALYHRLFESDFLRRIVRNSSYLVSGTVFSAGLGFVQNIFQFRILGPAGSGLLAATNGFTNVINRLTSFRISEMVVRYVRLYEERGEKDKAAAVFRLASGLELLGSVVAFIIIVLLADLGVKYFAKDFLDDPLVRNWFILYGTLVLMNLIFDSSDGMIQVFDLFKYKAMIDVAQSVVRVVLTVAVWLLGGGFASLVIAELAGRFLRSIAYTWLALRVANQNWGAGWWRLPFGVLNEDRKELLKFAFSTNLSGSISLIAKDSESLWVNGFLGNEIGGYYGLAQTLIGLLQIPIGPLPSTTYPELSKAVAKNEWKTVQTILKRGSLMAALYTLPVALGLIVFGKFFIALVYTPEFLPTYPIMVILIIGYGFGNVLYWNRAALLSFNRPLYPTVVNFIGMVIKVVAIILFARQYGEMLFAVLFAGYYIFTIGISGFRVHLDLREKLLETQLAPA